MPCRKGTGWFSVIGRRARCPQRAALSGGTSCGVIAGKSPKRRQRRKKRGDFEEVPRLAGMTMPASRLARRWAKNRRSAAPWGSCRRSRLRGENAIRSIIPFRSPYRPSQSPSVTALPEGEPSPRGPLPSAGRFAGKRIPTSARWASSE